MSAPDLLCPTCLGVRSGVLFKPPGSIPPMPITELQVRNAKASAKPYKIADGGGLFLLVTPAGGRLWRLKYRVGGREKLLSFGGYPEVGLKDARERRDQARRQLASGIDPSAAKRDALRAEQAITRESFRAIADEFVAKMEKEGRAPGDTRQDPVAARVRSCGFR